MKPINVLSCFDGMSCGQIALERAGIPIKSYHAFEIDKYAIQVTQKNYPKTVQLGDIERWQEWVDKIPVPDLLIAGSPCQGFSNAGKGLNFDDPRSKLFFTFWDILNYYKKKNPNLKWMLENVKMKQVWSDLISDLVGLKPVLINSSLVSAQNRQRLYWANWEFEQPEDKGIFLKDIVQPDCEIADEFIFLRKHAGHIKDLRQKAGALTGGAHSGGNHSDMTLLRYPQGAAIRNQVTRRGVEEQLNIRHDNKSNAVVPSYYRKLNGLVDEQGYRRLTPLECERLQTIPEWYTEGVSNTQRYKMLGNGWTVDVITHIFKALPKI